MPHVREHPLGPGQYESMTFKTWVSKVDGYGRERITGRLEGTYTVYCGEGNEHDFEVKEDMSFWNNEIAYGDGLESDSFLLFEIHHAMDSVNAVYEIAGRLAGYALEDWSDPCEVTEL